MDRGYDLEIKTDGVTAFILSVREGGKELTLSGWIYDRNKFKVGQRLLIKTGNQESRYIIKRVSLPLEPKDQYFIDLEFHPRS